MIRGLRSLDNRVVLGVHGVVVEERPRSYFRRRFNFHFAENAIDSYRLVNNLGTGTVGFHSRLFPSIDPHKWARGGMVDIYFAVECKKNMIPMVCINRHSGWLVDLDETKSTPTLFQEFNEKETLITNELKLAAPWGYAGIDQVVEAQDPGLRQPFVQGIAQVSSLRVSVNLLSAVQGLMASIQPIPRATQGVRRPSDAACTRMVNQLPADKIAPSTMVKPSCRNRATPCAGRLA